MLKDVLGKDLVSLIDCSMTLDETTSMVSTGVAMRAMLYQSLLDRATGLRPTNVPEAPNIAQIEFTHRCNLSCVFCYNQSGPENAAEIELDALSRVVDQLLEFDLAELVVSGGEPLIRPKHLKVVLESASRAGTPVHILTNGLLLNEDTLLWLRDYNVATIQISLDGADLESHDRLRGKDGAWERSYQALCLAHEYGFHTIVSAALTASNADTISNLIDASYLAGADLVNVGDIIPWGRAVDWMESGACTHNQYDAVAELLMSKHRGFSRFMSLRLAANMIYFIFKIKAFGPESILIRGNGDVIPHCTLSDLVVGNIHNESIAGIWENKIKNLPESPVMSEILNSYQFVCTDRLKQLRCFRKSVSEKNTTSGGALSCA